MIGNAYGTVELGYNSRNFVTKRTDGEGNTWHKFYDRMGNLTASYTPKQWEDKSGWEYRYDFLLLFCKLSESTFFTLNAPTFDVI